MKLLATVNHHLAVARRELRARSRLLAAAFARRVPVLSEVNAPHVNPTQVDLLNGLNVAGQAAGIQVWDWDLIANTLKFDHTRMDLYGGDAKTAEANPSEFIARAVHPEDLAHYRREFIRALKGEAPLCIDYRVVHEDGSNHPVQLRGEVFRGPSVSDQASRAIRVVGFTVDMGAQQASAKHIEQQAQQLQQWIERINLATETAGIGMWDWDLASGKLSSDTNMAGIFKDADLTGVTSATDFVAKILHPEDREQFTATLQAAIQRNGGDRVTVNFRYLRNDGGVQHVELHGRIVRTASGRAERFLGISWNVTAKMEARAEIERQSSAQRLLLERLNLATEVAGIDVWDWDLVTDHFSANAHITNAYGGTHFDTHNPRKLIAAILHRDDRAAYFAAIDQAIESGETLLHRYRMYLRDGTQRHAQVHARVFRNTAGNAIRMLGVSLDITEEVERANNLRRQADDERALRDRLNLATQTAGIGIWDKDLNTGAFIGDEQFWKITGLVPNDHLKPLDAIHIDERDQALAPLNAAFADPTRNEILAIRHRSSNPRSEPQFIQTHMRVFRDAVGTPVRLLGVTWDVTAEVLHAEELQRKARRESALVERLNITTQAAGISPWEFDLKNNRFSWHGQRLVCFGMDDVPLEEYYATLITIVLPEDQHLMWQPAKDAIENNLDSYQYRFRVNGSDGKIHHIQNYARILHNDRGKIRYCVGVTWDVTKEVEANALLAQRAEENRQLVERLSIATESASIGSWEMDLVAQRFLWVENPIKTLGIANEDFGSLDDFARHIVPEDRTMLPDSIRRAIKDNTNRIGFRYRALGVDGAVIHVQTFGRILTDENRRPLRALGVSWDITKEVQASEQLQVRAELERKLVDRLNVATQAAGISPWEFDLKTNKYIWFGARLPVLGLDEEPVDTYYEKLKAVLLPEDRNNMHDAASDAITKGIDFYSARYRANGIDGQIHYLKNYVRVLRSPRGTPYRLVGVTWDISEEVAASERLEAQVQHANALQERLGIATLAAGISPWEFELKTNKLVWLGVQLKVLGLENVPLEDYLAELRKVILPEDAHILDEAAAIALKDGVDDYSYRFRAISTDGQVHHLKNFVRILRNSRGQPNRLVGVTWDISDEIAASERLEQQVQHAQTLKERLGIATMAAGISPWEIDLVTGKFLWVENPIKALSGIRGADGKLTTFSQRIHPDDVNHFRNEIVRAAKGGYDVISYRYRGIAGDGSIVHVQTSAKLYFNDQRRATRALGVSWDVTRDVLAEEKERHQAQLERELMQRLSFALQAAGISLWEFDLKLNRYSWTGRRLPILGLDNVPVEEFYDGINALILPEDREQVHAMPREAIATGKDTYSCRYRVHGVDNNIHHLQNAVRILRRESGKPYRMVGITWDITAEVAAQALLRQQAEQERKLIERLNIATDSASISSWEIDLLAGKFLWIENRLKSVEYEDDNDLTLAHFSERIVPEDRALMPNAIRDALNAQSDRIGFRYRAIGVEGSIVHVQTFARFIVDQAGMPVRILGVSWDVTHEVVAAQQLEHQTERLRDVERRLERASLSSSEGHWEAELATGHLWCSSSFHTLLGYLEGELETRVSAFDRLVHPEDRAAYHDALRNHLVDNVAYDVDARMRMSNGEYRWFRMRGMAERNVDGQPTVMAGSIHDVQQQKMVEDALILAQHRFERAINGTQDGLWELDVENDSAWCSPRVALLLGYDTSHLGEDNFLRSLIHPEDVAKVAKVTESHYRHNTPFDTEVRLQTFSGEYRWYRARATADRDSNGRAVRLSGSLQDVTEARAAREELVRATEAAEAASRAKSAFLANVSHEIRTPMNGIIGMTGLLIDTQLDRTQRDYANTIRGSADSLLTVINDILDFSKIEAGKLDLENIELDLRANVEDVGAMMAFQAANKGLELIINVHPEVPDYVFGDPQRLRQCLINLIGNAIKFTKRGEIVVDVCGVGRQDGAVLTHFEVRDTGIGIPDATLKTLFQPFVQADSSTTRHFGGTGLGLSIVRRLVEMMGGQVGVVSKVGEGSQFFFTLSLTPKDTASATPLTDFAGKRGRILLVDDNATNRRVLEGLLVHQGHSVVCAASGAEALAHLRADTSSDVDMVITDFHMPDMDGLMLGEQIASDPSLAHLRLVMLTSLDRQGDGKQLAALGFAAYLTKPVRTRELIDCVTHVLSGEARQWQMEMRPMITRNSLSQTQVQQRFAGHVLLVEDNAVNQKVATRFLERMGCTVHVANHGGEGVEAFKAERFAIVLMDLQMPVMDGLTAARTIRELESGDVTRIRTPIIALTANAMRGDQERCEAAGMDGFLTKPIEIERLRDTLAKYGLSATTVETVLASNDVQVTAEETTNPPPINLARLNEITGGDAEFAKELIDTFIASSESQLIEIRTAIDTNDRDALARAAHKLKGACANIHAEEVRALVARLEAEAANATDTELHACNALLHRAFARAKEFLHDPSVTPAQVRAAS